jgi:hypothetical protein
LAEDFAGAGFEGLWGLEAPGCLAALWCEACDFDGEGLGAGLEAFAGDFFGSGLAAAGFPLCPSFAGAGLALAAAGDFPWA